MPGCRDSAAARAPAGSQSSRLGLPRRPEPRPGSLPNPGRPPRSRGNADCLAGPLDPLRRPLRFSPLPAFRDRPVAAQRYLATLSFGPEGPSWPHRTDPSFMLQCCNVSATEGEKRLRSQTKHKNWCVTHLLGYLQSPNCLPGVFLAEAARCLSLFFPRKMD